MATVKTNDLKKGIRIRLRNGWFATLADNARGNIRMADVDMADVEGFCREVGSVYSHNIVSARVPIAGNPVASEWLDVEHTPAQLKLRSTFLSFGF